jgi:hypothetical protein
VKECPINGERAVIANHGVFGGGRAMRSCVPPSSAANSAAARDHTGSETRDDSCAAVRSARCRAEPVAQRITVEVAVDDDTFRRLPGEDGPVPSSCADRLERRQPQVRNGTSQNGLYSDAKGRT